MAKLLVSCNWDEAPHLTPEAKAAMLASIPLYQREARSKGIPQLGSGAVYQVPESDIRIPDFPIPDHWPRGYGMDAGGGAKPTAAAWGAEDPATKILYLYSIHKQTAPEPAVHAAAVQSRGKWIPGVGDVAALMVTQHDAEQLIAIYKRLGLDIELPDKAVEAGIQAVWERLSEGRLKVFASCEAWFEEYRFYRRDDKGRIMKSNDHLMDGTRYLVKGDASGVVRMKTKPKPTTYHEPPASGGPLGWMA